MQPILHELTLDVLNPRKSVIHVVQDDSLRTIKLNLLNNGLPFDVRETSEVDIIGIVAFRKPDGHSGEYDTLSDGVTPAVEPYKATPQSTAVLTSWTVHLEGQVTACAGWTLLTVKFYKEDGQLIQTFPITLDVAKSATPLNEPSEDYHNVQSMADVLAAVSDLDGSVAVLEDLRTLRLCKTFFSATTDQTVALSNIAPNDVVKPGDFVITTDMKLWSVTAVTSSNVTISFVQGIGINRDPLVVNITNVVSTTDPDYPNRRNITSATLDKTLAEIRAADTLGRIVIGKYGGIRLGLVFVDAVSALFLYYYTDNPEDLSESYAVMKIKINNSGFESGYFQSAAD